MNIAKLVNPLLAQGLTHQEVMKTALKAGADSKKVSNYLAIVADAPLVEANRQEILGLQIYLLLLNLSAVGSLVWLGYHRHESFFYGMAGVAALFTVAFWYGISKHRAPAFTAVILLSATGCMQLVRGFQAEPGMTILFLALNVILISWAVRLKFKLFPNQNFFHSKKSEEGSLCY